MAGHISRSWSKYRVSLYVATWCSVTANINLLISYLKSTYVNIGVFFYDSGGKGIHLYFFVSLNKLIIMYFRIMLDIMFVIYFLRCDNNRNIGSPALRFVNKISQLSRPCNRWTIM